MSLQSTIFRFDGSISMSDVEATLLLSQLAVASLHGDDRVRLQARTQVDRRGRTCEIDMTSKVGQDLAIIFGGYIRREFGSRAVHLSRLDAVCAEAG